MSDRDDALQDLIRLIAEWVVQDYERELVEAAKQSQEAEAAVAD